MEEVNLVHSYILVFAVWLEPVSQQVWSRTRVGGLRLVLDPLSQEKTRLRWAVLRERLVGVDFPCKPLIQ